jgi:hypothetical protein
MDKKIDNMFIQLNELAKISSLFVKIQNFISIIYYFDRNKVIGISIQGCLLLYFIY